MVVLLLEAGATPTAKDSKGQTAPQLLMSNEISYSGVSEEQLREVLMALITKCPDLVKVRDAEGRTPLHFAFEFGKAWAVTMLVVADSDLRALDNLGRVPQQVLDSKLKSTGPGKKKAPTEWEKCETAYREAVEAINTTRDLRSPSRFVGAPTVMDIFAAVEREKRAKEDPKRP